jgi:hypothetical protein
MGLDQYLYANEYLSGDSYLGTEMQETYAKVLDALNAESFSCVEMPSIMASVKVAQWRKAHAVHEWFVENVQDGEDNCNEHYVSREQLEELLDTCRQVSASKHPDVAEGLLPSPGGIQEWYWDEIDDTIKQLERVLERVPEGWSLSYDSSW